MGQSDRSCWPGASSSSSTNAFLFFLQFLISLGAQAKSRAGQCCVLILLPDWCGPSLSWQPPLLSIKWNCTAPLALAPQAVGSAPPSFVELLPFFVCFLSACMWSVKLEVSRWLLLEVDS